MQALAPQAPPNPAPPQPIAARAPLVTTEPSLTGRACTIAKGCGLDALGVLGMITTCACIGIFCATGLFGTSGEIAFLVALPFKALSSPILDIKNKGFQQGFKDMLHDLRSPIKNLKKFHETFEDFDLIATTLGISVLVHEKTLNRNWYLDQR